MVCLDALISSKALLNFMMLLVAFRSFWSFSISFLLIPVVVVSGACCVLVYVVAAAALKLSQVSRWCSCKYTSSSMVREGAYQCY